MKIELNRVSDTFHLEAVNEDGNKVSLDASPEIGGTNKGMRPMQLLLTALGGCSSIDVINILKKQKQDLQDIRITVTGEREKDVVPAAFEKAHIHFVLIGTIDREKAEKAVSLSVEKYCSVVKTMEPGTKITHTFEIVK